MKKIRYIPYGYTMRNGQIVVDEAEAEVIRSIYDRYVSGDSLKTIAEQLTLKRVPYTEKTAVCWPGNFWSRWERPGGLFQES